jgi:esterase/lipase superfamily enzyme
MKTLPNLIRIMLLVAAVVSADTGPAASQQPLMIEITGIVRLLAANGATPYAGDATVALEASDETGAPKVLATTSIDADSRFTIRDLPLSPGTYHLNATLEQSGALGSVEFRITAADAGRTLDIVIDVTPRSGLRTVPEIATDGFVEIPVFFATDRTPGPVDAFGRASFLNAIWSPRTLAYGRAVVTIPSSHERGQLEGGDERYVVAADKVNHIILTSVRLSRADDFFQLVRANLNASKKSNPRRRVLIFIHGYKNSFDHAVRVAAQIKYDLLPVESTMILYSWPSRNTIQGYFDDQTSSVATASQLRAFLADTVAKSGGAEVSIIAHSMGNAALTLALEEMSNNKVSSKPPFENLIMAAPDIPAAELSRNSCKLARLARSMTLYASDHDQALLAAMAIAKVQDTLRLRTEDIARAGLAHPLLLALGVHTVDASTAVTDFLGHGYFSHDVDILSDIQDVLAGVPPPRTHLITRTLQDRNYWLFTPGANSSPPVALPRCPAHG